MKITPKKINSFLFFKLPLAYFGGVRVVSLTQNESVVKIKYKWANQNPFKSMFWAAQGMAAELSTGVLVMQAIEKFGGKVSMLVTHQEGDFFKKATGKILFRCKGGQEIENAIQESAKTKEGQIIHLVAEGIDENGVMVSKFQFQWSLKVKEN